MTVETVPEIPSHVTIPQTMWKQYIAAEEAAEALRILVEDIREALMRGHTAITSLDDYNFRNASIVSRQYVLNKRHGLCVQCDGYDYDGLVEGLCPQCKAEQGELL